MLKTYYSVVLDVNTNKPLNLSLNTSNRLTPKSSAAVTGVPLGKTKALEVPFKVRVTGKVAVVVVGITSSTNTVNLPTG